MGEGRVRGGGCFACTQGPTIGFLKRSALFTKESKGLGDITVSCQSPPETHQVLFCTCSESFNACEVGTAFPRTERSSSLPNNTQL